MKPARGIAVRPTPWQDIVIVCRKCSRKLDGGYGPDGDARLSRVLKTALRESGRRREVRVIESGCLGLCPNDGVALLRGSDPGSLVRIPAGTSAAEVLGHLRLDRPA